MERKATNMEMQDCVCAVEKKKRTSCHILINVVSNIILKKLRKENIDVNTGFYAYVFTIFSTLPKAG
jgi:hypothetical protein